MKPGDFSTSFVRGLDVIKAFTGQAGSLSVSEIAEQVGMSRAAVRRFLLTLMNIGYVGIENQRFFLMPKVLELGYAFLSQMQIGDIARPYLREVVEKLNESATIGILDWPSVVYVAREQAPRHILATAMGVGSRIPAAHSVIGRIILAWLEPDVVTSYLTAHPLRKYTAKSVTDPAQFRAILDEIRARGWVLVDEEWELGLIAIAVPIYDAQARVVAALSTGTPTSRATADDLVKRALPVISQAAEQISHAIRLSGRNVLGTAANLLGPIT